MAKSKIESFSKEEVELADIAKALSHPARIRILKILYEKNTCITGCLVDNLPLSQSTVSQHLMELKRVNLIQGEIDGPKTCYCIKPATMNKAREAFSKLFSKICNC